MARGVHAIPTRTATTPPRRRRRRRRRRSRRSRPSELKATATSIRWLVAKNGLDATRGVFAAKASAQSLANIAAATATRDDSKEEEGPRPPPQTLPPLAPGVGAGLRALRPPAEKA